MDEFNTVNPYSLADSDDPIKIRITCDCSLPEGYRHKWQGVVLLRPSNGRDWESTVVDAFTQAKRHGLLAPTTSACQFSRYDASTQDWVDPFKSSDEL